MTGGYVEKSFAPAPADLEAIGAFTRRAFAPEELYVFSVVLCNNDVDRDHEKFTRRALEELGALFVGKTGIFDHSMKSGDQAARIYATAVVPVPGRKTAGHPGAGGPVGQKLQAGAGFSGGTSVRRGAASDGTGRV